MRSKNFKAFTEKNFTAIYFGKMTFIEILYKNSGNVLGNSSGKISLVATQFLFSQALSLKPVSRTKEKRIEVLVVMRIFS